MDLDAARSLARQVAVQQRLLEQKPAAAQLARRMVHVLESCVLSAEAVRRQQARPLTALLRWRGLSTVSGANELQNWTMQQIARRRSAWLSATGHADLRRTRPPQLSDHPLAATRRRSQALSERIEKAMVAGDTSAPWTGPLRSSCVSDGWRLFAPGMMAISGTDTTAHLDREVFELDAAALAAADVQLHALAHSELRAREILKGHSLRTDAEIDDALSGLARHPFAALAALTCSEELRQADHRWRNQGLSQSQRRQRFDAALSRRILDQSSLRDALVAVHRELTQPKNNPPAVNRP